MLKSNALFYISEIKDRILYDLQTPRISIIKKKW